MTIHEFRFREIRLFCLMNDKVFEFYSMNNQGTYYTPGCTTGTGHRLHARLATNDTPGHRQHPWPSATPLATCDTLVHLRHTGQPATPLATGDTPGHQRHPWPTATPLATGDTPGHRLHPWPPATSIATGDAPGHWLHPWPLATPLATSSLTWNSLSFSSCSLLLAFLCRTASLQVWRVQYL
jgi:hypothetical protein